MGGILMGIVGRSKWGFIVKLIHIKQTIDG